MTINEAVKNLTDLHDTINDYYFRFNDEGEETFRMAVASLQAWEKYSARITDIRDFWRNEKGTFAEGKADAYANALELMPDYFNGVERTALRGLKE